MTLLKGIAWASLLLLHPLFDANGSFSIVLFTATIVITALAFGSARYLKYGVLFAAVPMALVVVGRLLLMGTVPSIGMAVLVIALVVFFQTLGKIIRAFHIEYLESKAERDQLIMELESARAISEEARRRAEDANLAKSRFLATMSHELRTPLNAILGFSEVISNEVMGPLNNEYYKEYINDIHRSGAHLLKLINEILDLSRVEAGRYELNEEATNLAHAAEESQQMMKLKASEKNVTLVMQLQPDLPQIWADARAIRQVILNLLSNALKFTPSGGTIWLKVGWTSGGGQYVSIKDTGPGIPEDEIPIVLSSFGQGSIAIKSAEQGTGLGLPIVQALVHMHDGTFELKSKLREGTEVIATFPRNRILEVMPAIPVDGTLSQPPSGANKYRKKVNAPSMMG
ncbi:MAG: HAMP domain-containing sensor histidine kinase [Rhizobiaceae bacterium]